MNKLLVTSIVYSIFIIGGLLLFINLSHEDNVNIDQGKEIIKKLETSLSQNDHSEEDDDAGYHYNEEFLKVFQNIDQTLNFFIAVLIEENEELFTSFFIPQRYSDDLWAYSEDPYFDNANYKIMREVNRNGTLMSARYDYNIKDGYKSTRKDTDVKLIFVYEDGIEVELSIDLVMIGTEHNIKDNIYFIENSVLELIEEIKRQTKRKES
ncbi:hypothetical protein BKP35_16450 [Anaerobacillus arseniciselenatis]|uniref:Uncharacterized protein n=1 Tax=Anaerobacillus arseniciselenatis TaxID=85682 RepID=A0A1S2LAV8_9BACI|nr:hypothetical protein [Anaerobacillus arseniciselenatis]OIJ09444.1 hypothetical protein BKP35_16450 [Anaerobacillus arseniciselenatis]